MPPAALRDELDDPVERAASETGDPAELVLRREELAEHLTLLSELPGDQQRVLIERAAGFEPAEIQLRMGLSSRQYRKRIEKARQRLGP